MVLSVSVSFTADQVFSHLFQALKELFLSLNLSEMASSFKLKVIVLCGRCVSSMALTITEMSCNHVGALTPRF